MSQIELPQHLLSEINAVIAESGGNIPDLYAYSRHNPDCSDRKKLRDLDCQCKKYIYIGRTVLSKERRVPTYSRAGGVVEEWARLMRKMFNPETRELVQHRQQQIEDAEIENVTVEFALEEWIKDKRRSINKEATLGIYYAIQKQLYSYCAANGWLLLRDLKQTARLTSFRNAWEVRGKGKQGLKHKQGRLVAFFAFCVRQGWLQKNPAGGRMNPDAGLSKIAITEHTQKPPFKSAQYQQVLDAHWRLPVFNRKDARDTPQRMHTFTQLLRHSGMAPIDAWKLRRDQLTADGVIGGSLDDNDQTHARQKNGKPIVVRVPEDVAKAVRNVPPGRKPHPDYFFWNGTASDVSLRSIIWRHYDRVFALLSREQNKPFVLLNSKKHEVRPHPYTFRDTFAVEELKRGCDIYQLAQLMGNTVAVIQKHYADYVPELRNEILERQRERIAQYHDVGRRTPSRPHNVVVFKRRAEVERFGS